jgi:S1-C subfamily serine protease
MCLAGAAAAQQPPELSKATDQYNELSTDARIRFQVLLTAAGYWNAVPNVSFSKRLFSATARYQSDHGWDATGILSEDQLQTLANEARPLVGLWGFKKVKHPHANVSIWVPFGLGLNPTRDEYGISWRASEPAASIAFPSYSGLNIDAAHTIRLGSVQKDGDKIHYTVKKPDFFVISASDEIKGIDYYIRYQKSGAGTVGFELYWSREDAQHHFERVATLMSGSLWASSTGAAFTEPTSLMPVARTASAPSTSVPSEPSPQLRAASSTGTGFFVSKDGHILTNAHVVDSCRQIEVRTLSGAARAEVLARDKANDLALLKVSKAPDRVATIRSSLRLGEGVAAFGFPLNSVLATSGNFTVGNVTALAGLGDDSRFAQVSAPVQPGNSGGPLLDNFGNVVGVVTAKLDALRTMVATNGDIPQNVNFAIKGAFARNFLESNRVAVQDGASIEALPTVDLAERARDLSVFIECQ